jgi:hypothetical protein
MLFCQPERFFNEMKYISDNRDNFMKKICLTEYKIPDNIEHIDPIQYLIKMVLSEPETEETNRIFALRTYGTNNGLVPHKSDRMAQTYFGQIDRGNLFVARDITEISMQKDGTLHYCNSDEYGDLYEFSLDAIALNLYNNPYDISSYIRVHSDMFEPRTLLAKIPVNLLQHLV